jgi:FixJ family two-component response regulator
MKKHVYIVDDDEFILASLQTYFRIKKYIVHTYASAQDFLNCTKTDSFGCLISDISMPGMSGIELQEALNERNFLLPTIFITAHADINIAINAMKLGAKDFVEKPFEPYILLDLVEKHIIENEDYFLINNAYLSMSDKERKVFKAVVGGGKNKEMSQSLFMSIGTIESYRSKIMKKMGASSFAELVNMSNLIKI